MHQKIRKKEHKRNNNMQRKYVKIVKTTSVLVWVYASPDFAQIQQHFAPSHDDDDGER